MSTYRESVVGINPWGKFTLGFSALAVCAAIYGADTVLMFRKFQDTNRIKRNLEQTAVFLGPQGSESSKIYYKDTNGDGCYETFLRLGDTEYKVQRNFDKIELIQLGK
jgi:hypothetical protein